MEANGKNIKKEGFFRAFIKSIKDFDKYEDFALESIGKTTVYLLKLIAIFTVVISSLTTYRFSKALNKITAYYDDNISQLSYEDGVLEINNNQKVEATVDDIYQNVIIDTSELTNEQIEKYKEELQNKNGGFLLLRDKFLYKNEMVQGITEKNYKDLLEQNNIQTLDKQSITNMIAESQTKIYIVTFVTTFILTFSAFFISVLLDALALGILGFIIARGVKLKLRYGAAFSVAVHSLTLPIVLNIIYAIIKEFTGCTVKYFQTMYTAIACIYVVTSILIIRSDYIKRQNELEKITSKGTFILGLDDSFPPMGFRNENNEIVGFDIDVAKEVCKRLNVELVVQPISWTAKEQELNSYNIDCIWNGMSINNDRKEAMCLSNPYLKNNMTFVVKKDSNINSINDLKGKKVGVQAGSTAEEILQGAEISKDLSQVVTYSENITAFMDMEINQTDAVFIDDVVANYYITSNNKDYRVLSDVLEEEEYAIGFRKNDTELCEKVNDILAEMKKDGSLGEISTKWFGKDNTIIKSK